MSTYYTPRAGLRNAASYQASGQPFVTGSDSLTGTMKIEFPYVTKELSFSVDSNDEIEVYFHPSATSLNKYIIKGDALGVASTTLNVKCKEIYVEAAGNAKFRVFASLTNIDTSHMYHLTGSGITE